MALVRTAVGAVAAVCAGLAVTAAPAVAAPAAPRAPANQVCPDPPQDAQSPWAQQLLAPDRAWPLSRGGSRRIALLDSGVDAAQPQLSGHVDPGYDATTGGGTANTDCLGTGTEVAGAIVGRQGNGGPLGVAPDAKVLPVRVLNSGSTPVDPGTLVKGINWAVSQQVDIICVDVAVYDDDANLSRAVATAIDHGIAVVAAVGDRGGTNDSDPVPYPAAYSGVIGVGAVDVSGARWDNSGHGSYVDLVAPGASVLTTWRGHGTVSASGTRIAAGFVAGTAALVDARWGVGPQAVATQLRATATPAADGPKSRDVGAGVVNPYGAVSELPAASSASPVVGYTPHTPSQAERDWTAAWTSSHHLAMGLAGGALAVVLLVILAAVALPRGRRRSWRPTLAPPTVDEPEPGEPSPPVLLFEDQ